MTRYRLEFANRTERHFDEIDVLETMDETGWFRVGTEDGIFVPRLIEALG